MRFRLLPSLIGWTVAIAFLGGLLALAYAFQGILRERRGPEGGNQGPGPERSLGDQGTTTNFGKRYESLLASSFLDM